MSKQLLVRIGIALVVLFVVAQLLPFGPDDEAPKTPLPAWAESEAGEIARRACFDCHTAHTVWPWYAKVAPVSWALAQHAAEGREHLDMSLGTLTDHEAEEIEEVLAEGEMPPANYLWMHSDAELSDAEKDTLQAALLALPRRADDKHKKANDSDSDSHADRPADADSDSHADKPADADSDSHEETKPDPAP